MGRNSRAAHPTHSLTVTHAAHDDPTPATRPHPGASTSVAAGPPVAADTRPSGRQAVAEVQTELAEARAVAETSQREQRAADRPAEVSYLESPEAFQDAYAAARARLAAGEEPIPYLRRDVTGGLGDRATGRAFGVELEFDLPGQSGARYERSLRGIAEDMHAAGLTRQRYQQSYHAARSDGYTTDPGGWRLEEDCTVAGEIVSPIMYDEPQTWENLEQVCEIVRRHGGQATYRTGGHVHIAVADYDHTVENHNRLLRVTRRYQDELYRLAQNPTRPRHRGLGWCNFNNDCSGGYQSISRVRDWEGHGHTVNFQSVNASPTDHVEFRLWDGSLSPAVIQTQIKLSLGLAAAAVRGESDLPAGGAYGSHRRTGRGRRQRGQEWRDTTLGFRALADTIFTRSRDKAQAAALFAVTRWQGQR